MNDKDFGKFLKKLRIDRSLKLRQVEMYSGVSNSYLSQLENGKRGIPSPEILYKLAPVYKIPYKELMLAAGHLDYKDIYKIICSECKNNLKARFTNDLKIEFYCPIHEGNSIEENILRKYLATEIKKIISSESHKNFLSQKLVNKLNEKGFVVKKDTLEKYLDEIQFEYSDFLSLIPIYVKLIEVGEQEISTQLVVPGFQEKSLDIPMENKSIIDKISNEIKELNLEDLKLIQTMIEHLKRKEEAATTEQAAGE